MTAQMKVTEEFSPVVLFIMQCKVVLTFESVDEIVKCDLHMKATEQYFPLVCLLCSTGCLQRLSLWTKS